MKHLTTFFLILSSTLCAQAQDVDKSITLGEVTVKASKVVRKPDGMTIYPTAAQKRASNNGYSMMEKLSLPNIRVDNINHTLSAIDERGSVQLRINGIVVGKQEMTALDPKNIAKIEFTDNPGVRYGEGIAYVIDITTGRNEDGYTIGTDLTAALTTVKGDGTLYGKWNQGKGEWSLSYQMDGKRAKGATSLQTANYTLTDGTLYTMERNEVESLNKQTNHNAKLTYNWADSTATVFQASVSGTFGRTPDNYSVKDVVDGNSRYRSTSRNDDRSSSPVLDLYFFRQLTPRQSVTANAVGTYISTKASSYNNERTAYQYAVDGKTASLLSEIIYENRLKPFTLSAGLNYSYKHTKNKYQGDASALTKTDNNRWYAFGEIKGALNRLRYALGVGASYIHYAQDEHSYHFWTFRPKASLSYNAGKGVQLNYTFQMSDRVSRIAMTSDVTIRTNSMEWTVGNPDLKPSHDRYHLFRLSYNTHRTQNYLEVFYKRCMRPNMADYERRDDNHFIYTQKNQKEIDVLNINAYASFWIVPEKLQVAANGGLFRCFNFGYDYTHCYTSFPLTGSLTAYLGNLTLQGYMDCGYRFLEGETKGFDGAYAVVKASYAWKDWQFSLAWINPFNGNYKAYESELLNRNLHKHTYGYSTDNGNLVSLNITWRLSRGKKHKAAEKRIHLQDSDNGIMK